MKEYFFKIDSNGNLIISSLEDYKGYGGILETERNAIEIPKDKIKDLIEFLNNQK